MFTITYVDHSLYVLSMFNFVLVENRYVREIVGWSYRFNHHKITRIFLLSLCAEIIMI